jgi:hypothetical protein
VRIVDGVLRVGDARPRVLDVRDRARDRLVEQALRLRIDAAGLGRLQQRHGLLEREVGLVEAWICGPCDADPGAQCHRRHQHGSERKQPAYAAGACHRCLLHRSPLGEVSVYPSAPM